MKFRILSILPNRWDDSAADIRGVLFTLIGMGGAFALKGVALDEGKAFLLSCLMAIVMLYWIPPIPKETYLHWILTNSVLLFGVYLFLFKIPLFFSGFLTYRWAQVICISVYAVCCWFLIRPKKRIS